MIGLGTAIYYSRRPLRPRIWSVYERKFKTDAHDGERHHRATPRYERRHAVYARYRERYAANDGAFADDY